MFEVLQSRLGTSSDFRFVFRLINHLFYVSMIATGRVPTIPERFYRVTYIAILLAALLLANTLLSQFYAAVLTSFRQHPPTTPVIETLAALERILKVDPSSVNVAVLNDTKYHAILNPREPTDLMKLIRNHTTLCAAKADCVELVLKRKHVLLASKFRIHLIKRLSTRESGILFTNQNDTAKFSTKPITI